MTPYNNQASIFVLLLTVCFASGADISCVSPVSVVKGQPVSLTCLYNQDLQKEKQDFYIYRYQSGQDAVIVAICAWEDSSLTCDNQPGYQATVQGRNVTLSVAHVDAEHAGNYTCTTLPPRDEDETEHCVLSVKGDIEHKSPKVTCFAPAHLSKDHPVSAICLFPDSLDADTVLLQRHDSPSSNKPVELVRCEGGDTCKVNEEGCPVKTEHNKADGFRIITAKINKAGHYICRATKDTNQEEICVMEIKRVAETSDGLNDSLQKLSAPVYGILFILVLAIVGVGVAVIVKRYCSKNTRCSSSTGTFTNELRRLPTEDPLAHSV